MPENNMLLRIFLSVAAVFSLMQQPAFAGERSAEVISACASSQLALDCACVGETYRTVTAGFTGEEDDAAVKMVKSIMMVPGVTQDEQYMMTAMELMRRVKPLLLVTESCKKMGGGADSASVEELSKINAICEKSDYFMDCGCVGYHYAKGAAGLPKEVQDYVRAVMGLQLGVETDPAYDDIPSPVKVQYWDELKKVEDFRSICSVPTPGGLAAARDVGETPAPTMEARADASARDSMRMWCEAESYKSPAFCACQTQTLSEIVPDRPFRFTAQSYKSLAAARLGRIKEDDQHLQAALAIGAGPDDVKALRKESEVAFAGKFDIASVACEAAIRDLAEE